MKKILILPLIVLFLSGFTESHAQNLPQLKRKDTVNSTFPCYDTKELFQNLRVIYQELPFVFGKADDFAGSTFSMWIGPTEKTFTLVATVDDLSCVVGTGTSLKLVPKELFTGK